ncbi:MAG: DUF5063 domain-containing protein [Proteobacteria bacterium]|nr:DUF5063 domain-containing protein [Verrucomicrobiota bacterium]NBU10401.1 DUF5063 domain-containing protein [Pseudomonadota bacterium]
MSLREDQRVIEFVRAARELRVMLESEPAEIAAWPRSLLVTLASLYALALKLPEIEVGEEEELRVPEEFDVTREQRIMIWNRVGRFFGEYDRYHDVFDPTDAHDHEVVGGAPSDDLMSMHGDIVPGLRAWEASQDEEPARLAVYVWRTMLEFHWGRHATDAVRVLHYLAEDGGSKSSFRIH